MILTEIDREGTGLEDLIQGFGVSGVCWTPGGDVSWQFGALKRDMDWRDSFRSMGDICG